MTCGAAWRYALAGVDRLVAIALDFGVHQVRQTERCRRSVETRSVHVVVVPADVNMRLQVLDEVGHGLAPLHSPAPARGQPIGAVVGDEHVDRAGVAGEHGLQSRSVEVEGQAGRIYAAQESDLHPADLDDGCVGDVVEDAELVDGHRGDAGCSMPIRQPVVVLVIPTDHQDGVSEPGPKASERFRELSRRVQQPEHIPLRRVDAQVLQVHVLESITAREGAEVAHLHDQVDAPTSVVLQRQQSAHGVEDTPVDVADEHNDHSLPRSRETVLWPESK